VNLNQISHLPSYTSGIALGISAKLVFRHAVVLGFFAAPRHDADSPSGLKPVRSDGRKTI
jgi:hypothetical protein